MGWCCQGGVLGHAVLSPLICESSDAAEVLFVRLFLILPFTNITLTLIDTV